MLDTSMDLAKTAAFELGEGARRCLLLHGFTGSPWDLRPLGESLAARGYRVKAIRLPGHGTTPRAMASVEARDWEAAAEDALLHLSAPGPVFVAGLSMGALLGVAIAARHPERVRGLALLAPALDFRDRALSLVRRLRGWPVLPLVRPWISKSATDLEDPDARADAPILSAYPSERLLDLLEVQDAARAAMPRVRAPCLVVSAAHDHVVSERGVQELERGLTNASVRTVTLTRGAHILPRDRDRDRLFHEVGSFFDGLPTG